MPDVRARFKALKARGGKLVVLVLNRVSLPQGLHAPFVATAAGRLDAGATAAPIPGDIRDEEFCRRLVDQAAHT